MLMSHMLSPCVTLSLCCAPSPCHLYLANNPRPQLQTTGGTGVQPAMRHFFMPLIYTLGILFQARQQKTAKRLEDMEAGRHRPLLEDPDQLKPELDK